MAKTKTRPRPGRSASRRDNFAASVKRELAERAHYMCSLCRQRTVGPQHGATGSVRAGDAAHITAAASNGPRYDASLTSQERRSSANGIWLCCTHAALVDRDHARYPTDDLRRLKAEHETWVTRLLERPALALEETLGTMLDALAIQRIREGEQALRGSWPTIGDVLQRLSIFGDTRRYSPVVRAEYLRALDMVVGRMRGAVRPHDRDQATRSVLAHIAADIDDAIMNALPIHSLVGRTAAPSSAELPLFDDASQLGGELAYDGSLYIRDLRVVEAGAEVLWRLLRFAQLNDVGSIRQDAEREFETSIDAARRTTWSDGRHALTWLTFKQQSALATRLEEERLEFPKETFAALQAAHGRA